MVTACHHLHNISRFHARLGISAVKVCEFVIVFFALSPRPGKQKKKSTHFHGLSRIKSQVCSIPSKVAPGPQLFQTVRPPLSRWSSGLRADRTCPAAATQSKLTRRGGGRSMEASSRKAKSQQARQEGIAALWSCTPRCRFLSKRSSERHAGGGIHATS